MAISYFYFKHTKVKRSFSQINFLIFRLVGGAPLSQATSGSDSKRPKTMLCVKFVANGTCRYGANCTFAHSVKEVKMALEMQAKQDTNGNPSENTQEIFLNANLVFGRFVSEAMVNRSRDLGLIAKETTMFNGHKFTNLPLFI